MGSKDLAGVRIEHQCDLDRHQLGVVGKRQYKPCGRPRFRERGDLLQQHRLQVLQGGVPDDQGNPQWPGLCSYLRSETLPSATSEVGRFAGFENPQHRRVDSAHVVRSHRHRHRDDFWIGLEINRCRGGLAFPIGLPSDPLFSNRPQHLILDYTHRAASVRKNLWVRGLRPDCLGIPFNQSGRQLSLLGGWRQRGRALSL